MLTLYYERVSTDRQSESGLGLEAQRKRNAAAAVMLGRDPSSVATYSDEGVSAAVPFADRSAARSLMHHISNADLLAVEDVVLIAYSLDRMFRDVDDGRATLKWFDDHGVRVILSNEGGNAIDTSSAMGRFLVTIRLAQGELERGLTGELERGLTGELERGLTGECTKAALGALRARGGKVGEPPYGWRKTEVRAKFEHDHGEQAVIAQILILLDGGWSFLSVANILNEEGHRTRDGKDWSHTQVSRIIGRLTEEA